MLIFIAIGQSIADTCSIFCPRSWDLIVGYSPDWAP